MTPQDVKALRARILELEKQVARLNDLDAVQGPSADAVLHGASARGLGESGGVGSRLKGDAELIRCRTL